jgi:O-antigen/teichoic acid export membrane protein
MSNAVEMPVKMTYHSNIPAVPQAGSPEADFPHDSGLFALDQSSINLKSKTIRGGAVTFIAQGIKVVLYVGSTVLLARLLTPSDFGLISMVTGITGFVEAFKDAGLSLATVQRAHINHQQVSTLFWINVGLSAFLMALVLVLSPALAMFYHEPRLTWVAAAIACTFLLGGLTVQHQALLRRNLRFKTLAVIDVISLSTGVLAAIGMAIAGFRYWALVGMTLVSALTNAIAVWIALPWRPGRPQRGCGVRPMIAFGGNIVTTRFVYSFVTNVPNVLIGWYWGAGAVGLYQKAYSLLMFAIDQIHAPVAAVALSPLSRVQSEPERFRRYFLAGYSIVISFALPVVVISAVFSEEIIRVVLGVQWGGAVGIFRWLAIGSVFVILLNPLGMVLQAAGRAARQVKITLVDSALVTGAYLAGLRYGPVGVAIGFVVVRALGYIPITCAMLKGTGIGLERLFRTALLPLIATLLASVAGLMLKFWLQGAMSEFFLLALGAFLMLSVYAVILLVVFGKWEFYRDVLQELLPRRILPSR